MLPNSIANFSPERSPVQVVTWAVRPGQPEHESVVHQALARSVADLLGGRYGGVYDPRRSYEGPLFFLPSETVDDPQSASELGIGGQKNLLGGYVPHAFVATKAITHSLLPDASVVPMGWSHEFGRRVADAVLDGVTAFCVEDALRAGGLLLEQGPVRVKEVAAKAGRGQTVIGDRGELRDLLESMDAECIRTQGVVLEQNLEHVKTLSVGQMRLGERLISYHGTQCLTHDNAGHEVYGGSTLVVVPGGYDELLKHELPDSVRLAVNQARIYDQAATDCFPGFFASRRNYDIAQGTDHHGRARSGVLEQSWRVGGATGAELAAMMAFADDPALRVVRAATREVFGGAGQTAGAVPAVPDSIPESLPEGATILYQGNDNELGFLTKYVVVQTDGVDHQ